MDVVVAGGHGQIALRLLKLLAQRGDRARGLIRNPDHARELEAAGAEAVACDMEAQDDLSSYVGGAEAIVFAAGAGAGSGPERKRTVDLGAAVKLIEAARASGIRRYVMVSSWELASTYALHEPFLERPHVRAIGALREWYDGGQGHGRRMPAPRSIGGSDENIALRRAPRPGRSDSHWPCWFDGR